MAYKYNIAIIGYSTSYNLEVAKIMADEIKELRLFDFNAYLKYTFTYDIGTFIEETGIDYYLKCVSKEYRQMYNYNDTILATSATAMTNIENIQNLTKNHYIIYIRTKPEAIINRIYNDRNNYLKHLTKRDCEEMDKKVLPLCDIVIDSYKMSMVKTGYKALDEFYSFMQKMMKGV